MKDLLKVRIPKAVGEAASACDAKKQKETLEALNRYPNVTMKELRWLETEFGNLKSAQKTIHKNLQSRAKAVRQSVEGYFQDIIKLEATADKLTGELEGQLCKVIDAQGKGDTGGAKAAAKQAGQLVVQIGALVKPANKAYDDAFKTSRSWTYRPGTEFEENKDPYRNFVTEVGTLVGSASYKRDSVVETLRLAKEVQDEIDEVLSASADKIAIFKKVCKNFMTRTFKVQRVLQAELNDLKNDINRSTKQLQSCDGLSDSNAQEKALLSLMKLAKNLRGRVNGAKKRVLQSTKTFNRERKALPDLVWKDAALSGFRDDDREMVQTFNENRQLLTKCVAKVKQFLTELQTTRTRIVGSL